VATQTAQVPKKRRLRNVERIVIRGTRLEKQAVRAVARYRGMDYSELLRRYSLNDVMEQFSELYGQQ
jgi:hypothetical protein